MFLHVSVQKCLEFIEAVGANIPLVFYCDSFPASLAVRHSLINREQVPSCPAAIADSPTCRRLCDGAEIGRWNVWVNPCLWSRLWSGQPRSAANVKVFCCWWASTSAWVWQLKARRRWWTTINDHQPSELQKRWRGRCWGMQASHPNSKREKWFCCCWEKQIEVVPPVWNVSFYVLYFFPTRRFLLFLLYHNYSHQTFQKSL